MSIKPDYLKLAYTLINDKARIEELDNKMHLLNYKSDWNTEAYNQVFGDNDPMIVYIFFQFLTWGPTGPPSFNSLLIQACIDSINEPGRLLKELSLHEQYLASVQLLSPYLNADLVGLIQFYSPIHTFFNRYVDKN